MSPRKEQKGRVGIAHHWNLQLAGAWAGLVKNQSSIMLKEFETMLKVTEKAQEQIAQFFKENEVKPIRLFLNSGCGGSQIALALDDKQPEDETFEFAGIQFLVNKDFLSQAQPIEIDFTGQGFKVSSSLQSACGCSGCGSSDHCC